MKVNLKATSLPKMLLPDSSLSYEDMKSYGYEWGGILPLSRERAEVLRYNCNLSIYLLHSDNTEVLLENDDEFDALKHQHAMYGVESSDWAAYLNKTSWNEFVSHMTTPVPEKEVENERTQH